MNKEEVANYIKGMFFPFTDNNFVWHEGAFGCRNPGGLTDIQRLGIVMSHAILSGIEKGAEIFGYHAHISEEMMNRKTRKELAASFNNLVEQVYIKMQDTGLTTGGEVVYVSFGTWKALQFLESVELSIGKVLPVECSLFIADVPKDNEVTTNIYILDEKIYKKHLGEWLCGQFDEHISL